jgi:hypothetical protein
MDRERSDDPGEGRTGDTRYQQNYRATELQQLSRGLGRTLVKSAAAPRAVRQTEERDRFGTGHRGNARERVT